MGVTTTPNIGLKKPDDTELAEDWVNTPAHQAVNNTAIENNSTITLTSYTPTLLAQTTNPNTGVGALRGEYQNIQGFITGSFIIDFTDPGVAAGSGEYGVSLPFVADGSFHSVGANFNDVPGAFSVIGEGFIMDNSAVATSGFVALDVITKSGVSYARLLTELFTAPAKTSRFMTNTMPFTVATGDCFSGSFFYKKA